MNQFTPWTPEEDKTLLENAHLTRKELMALLPGRSLSAILNRAQKKGWPLGRGGGWVKWTKEDTDVIIQNALLPTRELQKLLPHRTIHAIALKRSQLGVLTGYTSDGIVERTRRPLTDETAYQCRIEYNQKRELGYSHEAAVAWVAEANERDIDIVRDLITNPKHDAQVEECRQKYVRLVMIEHPDEDEVAEMLKRLAEIGPKPSGHVVAVVGTNLSTGEKLYYPTIKAASCAGFDADAISKCVSGKQKSHKGYIWERLKDYGC